MQSVRDIHDKIAALEDTIAALQRMLSERRARIFELERTILRLEDEDEGRKRIRELEMYVLELENENKSCVTSHGVVRSRHTDIDSYHQRLKNANHTLVHVTFDPHTGEGLSF